MSTKKRKYCNLEEDDKSEKLLSSLQFNFDEDNIFSDLNNIDYEKNKIDVIEKFILYKFLAYNWTLLINYSINIFKIDEKIFDCLPNPHNKYLYNITEIIKNDLKNSIEY